MAFNFPFEMFMQAQDSKSRNRQQMYQDISGLGQGLGQGLASIGEAVKDSKRKQMLDQIVASMKQPTQVPSFPQGQGQPNMPLPPPGGQPMPSQPMPGMMPRPPEPPQMQAQPQDPVMQAILPFLQADPSLMKESMPAIIHGEYLQHRPGSGRGSGMTDFQTGSLEERKRQFDIRQKSTEAYQTQRNQMMQMIEELHAKGLDLQAKRLKAMVADMDMRHWVLNGFGIGTSPSEAAGIDSTGGGVEDPGLQ